MNEVFSINTEKIVELSNEVINTQKGVSALFKQMKETEGDILYAWQCNAADTYMLPLIEAVNQLSSSYEVFLSDMGIALSNASGNYGKNEDIVNTLLESINGALSGK